MGIPRHIGRCHGHRRSSRMSYSVVGFSGDAIGRLRRGDVTSSHQNPILKIEMRQNRHCHFGSHVILARNRRCRRPSRTPMIVVAPKCARIGIAIFGSHVILAQNRRCIFVAHQNAPESALPFLGPMSFCPESEMSFRRRFRFRFRVYYLGTPWYFLDFA